MAGFHNIRSGIGAAALFAGLLPLANAASAAVEISTNPTANMTCSGGVCAPTAKKAVLNVNDLAGMLASGDTAIKSTSQNPDIEIDTALNWTSAQRLTLDSYHAIAFNSPVEVKGTGALTITTNDGGTNGDFQFFGKEHVKFRDVRSSLIVNGHSHSLVKSFRDLQRELKHGGGGYFALAESINSASHSYRKPPIRDLSGTFEGLGNTISNLTINDPDDREPVGLFGAIDSFSTVRDIGLVSASVHGGGIENVGVLAGQLDEGSIIKNSFSTGEVSGGSMSEIGGLVGENSLSMIINSHSDVSVTAADGATAAGGLIGYNQGGCPPCMVELSQSFATGIVSGGDGVSVGGLVGENSGGTISDTYSTGAVVGGSTARVGGLIGLASDSDENGTPVLSTSYSTGAVSGGSGATVGGLIGQDTADALNTNVYWDLDTSGISNVAQGAGNIADDPGITGLSDAQLKSGLPMGFDKKVWKEKATLGNGYPTLIDNPPPK
jgi:hypothetical protein